MMVEPASSKRVRRGLSNLEWTDMGNYHYFENAFIELRVILGEDLANCHRLVRDSELWCVMQSLYLHLLAITAQLEDAMRKLQTLKKNIESWLCFEIFHPTTIQIFYLVTHEVSNFVTLQL